MSPEMLTGEPLTPASDIFAFGLVLAHAAGVRPFGEGPQEALSYRIVHQEPYLAGLEHGLGDLIARCLAKDPTQRPTPAQILEALAPPMMGSSWLPAPVRTIIEQQTPLGQSAPQNPADVAGRTPPRPPASQLATEPPPRKWPSWLLPVLAATVLIPSLALLALAFSQGQGGSCGLFAASADAAMMNQNRALNMAAEAACQATVPRWVVLICVVGVAFSASLTFIAIRRNRKY